jgi:hypothetical protein
MAELNDESSAATSAPELPAILGRCHSVLVPDLFGRNKHVYRLWRTRIGIATSIGAASESSVARQICLRSLRGILLLAE